MQEANYVDRGDGARAPQGPGWYVLNLGECPWLSMGERFGGSVGLPEGSGFGMTPRFQQLGVNVRVLEPGKPSCFYHRESVEEAFLVLSGECLLLVEGEERPLRSWDFVALPPGVAHVFVGAGSGPCALLQLGARVEGKTIEYPVDELAARHGASVREATDDPRQAYAEAGPMPAPIPSPWGELGLK